MATTEFAPVSMEELNQLEVRNNKLFKVLEDLKMHYLEAIIVLATELDWQIKVPHMKNEDEPINGLSIGSSDYISSLKD